MKRLAILGFLALGFAVTAACSDDEAEDATGGSGGSSGSAGSAGTGTGGATGGTGGGAGTAGAAGSDGGVVACDPPTDTTKAALCLSLKPEALAFQATNPAFDGTGVLLVEIFDTPTPDENTTALATQLLPAQTSDGGLTEATLASLVAAPVRFDDVAVGGKRYARAVFIDNPAAFTSGGLPVAGVWVAGIDLSKGIAGDPPLTEVALTAGQGLATERPLLALRKLAVTVKRAAGVTPAGDGQGSLAFVVTDGTTFDDKSQLFGFGAWPCGDLSGSAAYTIDGFVIGNSPRNVAVFLDDYGVGSAAFPAGTLSSVQNNAGVLQIPASGQLNIPENAYGTAVALDLITAFGAPDGGGADAVSCTSPEGGSSDGGVSDASTD